MTKKQSEALKAKWQDPQFRAAQMQTRGTKEYREKLSKAQRGVPHPNSRRLPPGETIASLKRALAISEAARVEAEAELAAVQHAAHMPDDYDYGLPSWINQRLWACYIGRNACDL